MTRFTKTERLHIYYYLMLMCENHKDGYCRMLFDLHFFDSSFSENVFLTDLPELRQLRPASRYGFYWFPKNNEGMNSRITLCAQAIHELLKK